MTAAEQIAMDHLKANARAWRWTTVEILACARHHASLDPYQLSRLPDLMAAEIDKSKSTKKEAT